MMLAGGPSGAAPPKGGGAPNLGKTLAGAMGAVSKGVGHVTGAPAPPKQSFLGGISRAATGAAQQAGMATRGQYVAPSFMNQAALQSLSRRVAAANPVQPAHHSGGLLGAISGLPIGNLASGAVHLAEGIAPTAAKVGLNLGSDIVNLPKNTLTGVEGATAAFIHDELHPGEKSQLLPMMEHAITGDPIVHGITTGDFSGLVNHPLQGVLDATGVYGLAGRAGGALARTGALGDTAKAATQLARPARELAPGIEGTQLLRHYSPNAMTQAIQKAADAKGVSRPASGLIRRQVAQFMGPQRSQLANDVTAKAKGLKAAKPAGKEEAAVAPYLAAFGGGRASLEQALANLNREREAGILHPTTEATNLQHAQAIEAALAKDDAGKFNWDAAQHAATTYVAQQAPIEAQKAALNLHTVPEMERALAKQYALQRVPGTKFLEKPIVHPDDIAELRAAKSTVNTAQKELNQAKVDHATRINETTDLERQLQKQERTLTGAKARAGMDAMRQNTSDAALRRLAAADEHQERLSDFKTQLAQQRQDRVAQGVDEIAAKKDALQAAKEDLRNLQNAPRRKLDGLVIHDPTATPVPGGALKGQRLRMLPTDDVKAIMSSNGDNPAYLRMTNPERERPLMISELRADRGQSAAATGKEYTGKAAQVGDWRPGYSAMQKSQIGDVWKVGTARMERGFLDRFGMKSADGQYFTDSATAARAAHDYAIANPKAPPLVPTADVLAGADKYLLVPKPARDEMRGQFKLNNPSAPAKVFLGANRAFRNTQLPTSPRLPVMHTVENITRGALAGATPLDWLRARQVLRGMAPEDAQRLQDLATPGGLGGSQHQLNVEDFGRIASHPLEDQSRIRAAAPAIARTWENAAQRIIGWQRFLESHAQTAALGVHMRKQLQEFGHTWLDANTTVKRYTDELARGYSDPKLAEDAANYIHKTMGQYNNWTARQRWVITRATPFAPWYVNAARLVFAGLPAGHPLASALIQDVRQATAQQWNAQHSGLPADMQSSLKVGPGAWLDVGKFTPIGIEKNPVSEAASLVLPQYAGALHAVLGQDPFGGDFRGPDTAYGKQEMKGGLLGDQAPRAALQALDQILESFGGPLPLVARAVEQGNSSAYNTSMPMLGQVALKPGTNHSGLLGPVDKELNPLHPTYFTPSGPSTSSTSTVKTIKGGGLKTIKGGGLKTIKGGGLKVIH
jgi:hypothetical protein